MSPLMKLTLFRLLVATTAAGLLLQAFMLSQTDWSLSDLHLLVVSFGFCPLTLLLPAAIWPRRATAALSDYRLLHAPVATFAVLVGIGMLYLALYCFRVGAWSNELPSVIAFGGGAWGMVAVVFFGLDTWVTVPGEPNA